MSRLISLALSIALALPSIGAAPQGASARSRSTLQVEVTAYCVEGETASGEQTRTGIVAADPSVIPLGSVIRVRGLRGRHNRTYRVEDTGRKVKGRVIDIFMEDCGAAKRFGRQRARVRILERAEPSKPR